jgi:lysophospholipase L1-like esterase
MQFTTKIPIPKSNHPIDYDSKLVSLGSCFAVNIAEKFNYYKFQNTVNPFGILFHPLAIQEVILRAIQQDFFIENDVFFHNERWHCFDTHSDLSHSNKEDLLQNLNQNLTILKSQIQSASHLLITFGTAWVYREKVSQKIVANCHKVPQSQFEKELLSATAIQKSLENTIAIIRSVNPNANIVFTISPVRHLIDGFIENQQSKANLIIGIHQTIKQHHSHYALYPTPDTLHPITYFPSYEIMMDELRDYRFYAEDMIHPNQTAIDYIWERFVATTITEESIPIMEEVTNIQKALAHKPFNPDSQSHQKFLLQLNLRMAQLQKKLPNITF